MVYGCDGCLNDLYRHVSLQTLTGLAERAYNVDALGAYKLFTHHIRPGVSGARSKSPVHVEAFFHPIVLAQLVDQRMIFQCQQDLFEYLLVFE